MLDYKADNVLRLSAPEATIVCSATSIAEVLPAEGVHWNFRISEAAEQADQEKSKFFGSHIREAIDIVRDWRKNP